MRISKNIGLVGYDRLLKIAFINATNRQLW
jgi:hypothetical protein